MVWLRNLGIVWLLVIFLALVGECKCLYKFCTCDFTSPYKAEAIYGIATLTGFGSIVGWFNIED